MKVNNSSQAERSGNMSQVATESSEATNSTSPIRPEYVSSKASLAAMAYAAPQIRYVNYYNSQC